MGSSSLRRASACSLILLVIFVRSPGQPASLPGWWSSGALDANEPTDNWAMANVGQLKNIATQAKAHLDTQLGLGASDWDAAYGGNNPFPFSSQSNPENFSAVNIGQLKFIATGFYNLLHSKAPTYDVVARLTAMGVPGGSISGTGPYYPWVPNPPVAENWSAVTIGQLKIVFSFDLTSSNPSNPDSDNDGLPDAWEIQYFGNTSQTAAGDSDGDGLSNLIEFQLGRNPTKGAIADTTGSVNLRLFLPSW
jgi:hypothetical protein